MQKVFVIFILSILLYSCGENEVIDIPVEVTFKEKSMDELRCLSGDCENGSGTWSTDGYVYRGEFKDGLRHGKGTCSWIGQKYEYKGEWNSDQFSGEGTLDAYGNKYTGSFLENKKNGKGTQVFKNGNKYEGMWLNNLQHGEGTYSWKNGDKYKGEFESNKKHGKGTYTWSNGNKYVGMWKNNKQHGKGTTYTNFHSKAFRKKLEKYGSGYDRIRKRIWENGNETNKNW